MLTKILWASVIMLMAAVTAFADVKLGVTAGNRVTKFVDPATGKITREETAVGAAVLEITPGSVAEKLKLQKDDLIRGVVTPTLGKRKIDNIANLIWTMENSTEDATQVYYIRGGTLYWTRFIEKEEFRDVSTTIEGKSKTVKIKVKVQVPQADPADQKVLDGFKPASDK